MRRMGKHLLPSLLNREIEITSVQSRRYGVVVAHGILIRIISSHNPGSNPGSAFDIRYNHLDIFASHS